jgi:hypothetical protein
LNELKNDLLNLIRSLAELENKIEST